MTRRFTLLLTLAATFLVAGTAHAQFSRRDPATGEVYRVEVAYGWWRPEPTISVASEGLGIPPSDLEMIFERYSRVDSQATKDIPGTGLGLPIVRQIVQLHGGKVWAESELGRGSVFHVALPLAGMSGPVEA